MNSSIAQKSEKPRRFGFTLIEVLISFATFSLVASGLIYGYVQVNRMAEWSSMSLAAQSIASQEAERAKSAQWDSKSSSTTYPNLTDPMGYPPAQLFTNYATNYTMDVPSTGAPIVVSNYLLITNVYSTPIIRMIRSDCVWTFPLTGIVCTNSVVTLRAPDQ